MVPLWEPQRGSMKCLTEPFLPFFFIGLSINGSLSAGFLSAVSLFPLFPCSISLPHSTKAIFKQRKAVKQSSGGVSAESTRDKQVQLEATIKPRLLEPVTVYIGHGPEVLRG